jgi:serine/threonine protein kinase/Flp pilus assembly protein TadD
MVAVSPELKAIFWEALECCSEADRRSYLDRACGSDPALRSRVAALLVAHHEAGDFLEQPVEPAVESWGASAAAEGPGTFIGPYKLVERIGEGGMGVIYLAEQERPVRREVAIKIIKPGMDTRQVIARFEVERQALAMMDHPCIATVFEAGATELGRPFFVMELVRGISITDYCDRERLALPQRLELFVLVCRAVQHAHQKGIIHRDLKPSNVLVTVKDGAAVPKVIDFGIAKATSGVLNEPARNTEFHQLLGTPLYMSPEQAALAWAEVDTRSDVYSLGVLLYELLTGTTPFDWENLGQAAFDEMRRVIRELEPPRPSAKLSSLGDTLRTVSANRSADPRHLGCELRGELDWIVMKALEKDPRRRYETVSDFAADVLRYLLVQPVNARPPSRAYRFRKFAVRNKRALVASALIAAVLVAAAIVSTWQTVQTTLANSHLRMEQGRTKAALAAEAKRRRLARRALDAMSSQIVGEWLSKQPTLLPEHKRFLEQALLWYEELAADTGSEEATRAGIAAAYYRIGAIHHLLGQSTLAEAAYRKCLTVQESLVRDFPSDTDHAALVGTVYRLLGGLERERARPEAALPWFEKEVQSLEPVARRHPNLLQARVHVAEGHHYLGLCWDDLGRTHEAELAYRQALPLLEQIVREFPDQAECASDLGQLYGCVGSLERGRGRSSVALAWYEKAIETLQPVVRTHRELSAARSSLGNNHSNRAIALRDLGRRPEAEEAYKQSVRVLEALAAEFPGRLLYRQPLASANCNLGDFLVEDGRLEEAEPAFKRARDILEPLVEEAPGTFSYPVDLGMTYYGFAMLAQARGRPEAALPWIEKAIRLLSPVAGPSQPQKGRFILHVVHCGRAQALSDLGRPADALESWDQAIALALGPVPGRLRLARAATLANLGDHAKATAAANELANLPNIGAVELYNLACVYALSSAAARNEPPLNERYAIRAVELLHQAVRKGYRDVIHMKQDTDLNSIRARPDYHSLARDLSFPRVPFAH